jgi:GDP-4-dehydro-6-deoxy-D-mannose reductase
LKAAITGARGFVGRHLTAHLQQLGDDVVGLDLDGEQPVDVTDAAAVRGRIASAAPDVVYHLAARTHVGESWETVDAVRAVNVDGTAHVLTACADVGVRRALFVGSAEQYGRVEDPSVPVNEDTPLHPVSPYAQSKADAEALALELAGVEGLDVVCVRAFNHTGPGQSPRFLVPAIAARIARAEHDRDDDIAIGNLDPVRDYSDVRDVVRAYRLLIEHGESGLVYNVCSGRGVSVAEIARGFVARATRPLHLTVDPSLARATDVPILVGDATRLVAATGWEPQIPLDRTLDDVLDDARAAL